MATVLVIARRAVTRARLERAIAGSDTLRLLSAPADLPCARQLHSVHPDVVLLAIEGEPLEASVAALRGAHAVVLLADTPRRALDQAIRGGLIRGVLPPDASAGEIVAAVGAVAAGLVVLHADALPAARGRALTPARPDLASAEPLTAREIDVLRMLTEGLANKEIAVALGISRSTAKFHVASIMAKLGAGSRTEAVTIGMRRGLVAI